MAFSVNTNAGALIALQNLNKTNAASQVVQGRINTGMKVAGAKDNAAVFAIAQGLRADVAGLNSVQSSLDRAISTSDVAIAAGEAVSDLLIEMKGLATSAADGGITSASRSKLDNDFQELRSQITSIVNSAEFNGTNAVKSGGDAIIAITDSSASTANSITIAAQDLTLSGLSLSAAALDTAGSAASAVAAIATAADSVVDSLSSLGAGAKRLELQKTFTAKLSDTIEIGIGNLVDADLAKESANLQSLQVKQQLGLQALSIANQAPGAVLSLFR